MRRYRISRLSKQTMIALIMAVSLFAGTVPSFANSPVPSERPVFTQIIAGTFYSAALRSDGTVWTWGRNLWSELGIQENMVSTSVAAPVRLTGLSDIVSISTSGSGYQLAVKNDGTVWEWGNSLDNLKKGILPRQVKPLSRLSKVAAGAKFGFGLLSDGTVWTWPRSKEPSAGGAAATVQPMQITRNSDVLSLYASGDTVYLYKSDGTVWTITASLDTAGEVRLTAPVRLKDFPTLTQCTDIGYAQACIDANGKAWLKNMTEGANPKPVPFHPELKVKSISSYMFGKALLLTQSGDVYSFDMLNKADKGKKILFAKPIKTIAAGSYHLLALDAQGRIYGWGADNWNETGGPAVSPDHMVYAPMEIRRDITILSNGKPLATVFPAILAGGSISVPLKDTLRSLGGDYTVTVNGNAQWVSTISYKGKQYVVQYKDAEVLLNGAATGVSLPANFGSTSGVTMLQCAVLKQIGISCTWNSQTGVLSISG
ncbi:alpha-tubulin suppressor-like RCC1 family protein [Paenibacillus taihuensis]|uniref:Alpha-tubulin suppressor-like RCC1 family protein n=1 Tax=Paenibacillus taihuensis TaxID=1156355 RepID=A0A3D9R2Y9_9BACL|nr:hypothetical protein [Paenibacillus taihuensis]REE67000.1 alpha-tubulin suppressor-like RCC1 family protein [Paenibacillus taihuensis]